MQFSSFIYILRTIFETFFSNDSCFAGCLSAGHHMPPSWMGISVLACFWSHSGYYYLVGWRRLPWWLECKYGLLRCACMPNWKGIDRGHSVLSAGPGWTAFPRSLFLTCVWLGWATWEILLRYLGSQNVATAILHTFAYLMLLCGNHQACDCSTFLWSLNQFLWFLSQRWRFHMSQLLQFDQFQGPMSPVSVGAHGLCLCLWFKCILAFSSRLWTPASDIKSALPRN